MLMFGALNGCCDGMWWRRVGRGGWESKEIAEGDKAM